MNKEEEHMSFNYIQKNLEQVLQRIEAAAKKVNRSPQDIHLIGVTKTHPVELINASIACGISQIGENKVQEIQNKYSEISPQVPIHLIGHLQTNKVKYIIDKVDLIQSVDRIKLADEIQKRAEAIDKIQEVLIQVNVADEVQKSGVSEEDYLPLLKHLAGCSHIKVKGLMNIPPLYEDEAKLRSDYKKMRQLWDAMGSYGFPNVDPQFLSMGMSGDFEIAIEEGANMVRIGSVIYGAR